MTYTKTTAVEVKITTYPSYFQFGGWQYCKVMNPTLVIYAFADPYNTNNAILETRRYMSNNDWEPCDSALFYEAAATAMQRINDGCNIVHLELEGGAYAD